MRSLLPALLLTIAVTAPMRAAAPVRDTLIVPGMRVGPIALGMTAAELNEAVGVPAQAQRQGSTTIYSWGDVAAEISDGTPGVDLIAVNDARYETANHLRVGLAALAVNAVMGLPDKSTNAQGILTLDYDGLTVVVRNALVAQIRVRK
jgi:hypothetical protein